MQNVMIDLETLGRRAGCAILSIGAVAFDLKQGLGQELYVVVNRQSCNTAELHEDLSTLDWWNKQSDEAKKVLTEATQGGVVLVEALSQLTEYLKQFDLKKVKVWGNGSDFDNAILTACYAAVGQDIPWEFWNNRCYRTLKSLKPSVKMQRQGTYHNALDDAKSQALHALQLMG